MSSSSNGFYPDPKHTDDFENLEKKELENFGLPSLQQSTGGSDITERRSAHEEWMKMPFNNIEELHSVGPWEETISAPAKSKLGRKLSKSTAIFNCFHRHSLPIKKEYIRVKLIRGWKRAIREISDGFVPGKKIHGFHASDTSRVLYWQCLSAFVLDHPNLQVIAQTESGPNTDGKAMRTTHGKEQTHNDKFCKQFFSREETRLGFELYLQVVFGNMEDADLCRRFSCSPVAEGEVERKDVWVKMREYWSLGMYEELGIKLHRVRSDNP